MELEDSAVAGRLRLDRDRRRLIYYFAPDVEQDYVWITPGALVATVLWLLGSLAFRFYFVNFGSYNETYGAIGGGMVLLTWLYLTGPSIIVGAEMNAEIEHASPHGKDVGEKVPGERPGSSIPNRYGRPSQREFLPPGSPCGRFIILAMAGQRRCARRGASCGDAA